MRRAAILASALFTLGAVRGPADTDPIALVTPAEAAQATRAEAAPNPGSIGQLAKARGMRAGTSVEAADLASGRISRTITQNFTTLTPENALKIGIFGRASTFDWTDGDRIARFAREHGLGLRVHPLVWEHRDGLSPGMAQMSPRECTKFLHDHAEATIGRYADVLEAVDVVNEPLDPRGGVRMTHWSACLGADPITVAFQAAHDAAARAGRVDIDLVLNEYDVLTPGPKADGYWLLAQNLKDRGTPVTTIGFQAHLSLEDKLDERAVRDNLKRFADMGYRIEITELDVTARNPRTDRTKAATVQAELVSKVVSACLAAAGPRCVGVTSWGLTDDVHHKVRGVPGSHETPTLFDDAARPKPAYAAMARALAPADAPATVRLAAAR